MELTFILKFCTMFPSDCTLSFYDRFRMLDLDTKLLSVV